MQRLQRLLECPICLQPAAEAPQLLACCGQTLCGLCLQACLAQADQCPLCRRAAPPYGDNRVAQGLTEVLREYGRIARKRKHQGGGGGAAKKRKDS